MIEATVELFIREREEFLELVGPGWRPPADHWLDRGSTWSTSERQHLLNSLVRWTRRRKAPQQPRGIELCLPHELDRWEKSQWACNSYHFRDSNCPVRRSGEHEALSVRERESS